MIPGLSIDDEGRFLVHGEAVTHERTLEVLWRGLEPSGEGWVVRVGRGTAPVTVDGTPFVVTGIAERPGNLDLLLAGGGREPLVPDTLRVGADGRLRTTLASGHRPGSPAPPRSRWGCCSARTRPRRAAFASRSPGRAGHSARSEVPAGPQEAAAMAAGGAWAPPMRATSESSAAGCSRSHSPARSLPCPIRSPSSEK